MMARSGSLKRGKIAIIGAGWAGLAAAVELAGKADVTLFEASRVAGGRARGVADKGFSFLDNGQHLLIGAYRHVFELLDKIGVNHHEIFLRQPMQWHLHDGVQFRARRLLPAPFHLLTAILQAKGARLPEKLRLLHQITALTLWHKKQHLPDVSVAQWLEKQHVSQKWQAQFWQPLVWGALNTPMQSASLRVLANVLADGIWHSRENSNYCLPKVDLGAVLANPALSYVQARGVRYLPEHRVQKMVYQNQQLALFGETFDRAIVAVAPYHLLNVLPENWLTPSFQAAISQIKYHAITTVYLRYNRPVALPAAITGFADGTTQWLIDRSQINGANEIAAVISVSDQHGALSPEQWVQRVQADLQRILPDLPAPIAVQTITEKRATIAADVQRPIPNPREFAQYGVLLAGDYFSARYPATLETAVQSGMNAARQILKTLA
ncbi:hydroxysqualene dehydroxylase HpnE [Alysiella filiformis]|uniref:Flavin containing amine oxidoreductase n=1 Tax=Alysiella filiformis DSM 16848 TaxID=1120981 RepID=A0A286EE16_9NEIS|nr:hydroxysqualene dehydroxylase HpnE [Alysiella filiformis]UBQ56089.1 hydroxysqualene dehydroxylase HpnE [Alysiella filiformis DSM 16848]SOD69143.1 Flavin containing amine oxidoreductase [Alysiella filiformis DSM 16848]